MKLFDLLLVVLLLLLRIDLSFHHAFSSVEAFYHALDVQKFTLEPDIRLFIRVFDLLSVCLNLVFEIGAAWMSQDSRVCLVFRVIRNADLLKLHELVHHLSLSNVLLLATLRHALQLFLLQIHDLNRLF